MTVTTPADTTRGGGLTLTAGIGDGSSGAVGGAVSIAGGDATGGAVSVTSGVGTSDDSGSMTIATANSGSSGVSGDIADNRGVGLRGDGGVYGGDGQRDWRRGGCDFPERGGWQHRRRRGGDRDGWQDHR